MADTPASAAPNKTRKPRTPKVAAAAAVKPARKAPTKPRAAKSAVKPTPKAASAKKLASNAAAAATAAAEKFVGSVDWKAQAEQVKTQAGKVARNAAATAKDTTGSAMQSLAKLISDTAGTVDSKLGPQYGDYARTAAEAVAGAAKSLDDTDIDQLIEEARTFVRKSPAVAIGAAAIAGFVLMRLAKGSGDDA